MAAYLDHIVITAPALESGIEYVRAVLGVDCSPGGEHERMGTHNALLRLSETVYLEVIAPNPHAPEPRRHRWFGLGRFNADTPPRLSAWIARVSDLDGALNRCPSLGIAEAMSRAALDWRISIPADGSLPFEGVAPTLIEWSGNEHPARRLPDVGASLVRLEGYHPDVHGIATVLRAIGFADEFYVHPIAQDCEPRLVAHVATPQGLRVLGAVP